jgi:hypothetical protein
MKTKNTINTNLSPLTLKQKFSPDIIMFLNSVSEPEIRHLITLFQREKETVSAFETSKNQSASQLPLTTPKMTSALQALENLKPSFVTENSTQLLREIRDNE